MRSKRKLISRLSRIKKMSSNVVFQCWRALFQKVEFHAFLMINFCKVHSMLKIHLTTPVEKQNKAQG